MKKLTLSIALSIMLSSMTSAEVLFVEQDEGTFAAPMTSETLFASNDTSHYHEVDRDRENHTGTQTASTISDFDISVNNLIDNYNIDDTYKLLTLEDFVDNKIANASLEAADVSGLETTIDSRIDNYQIDATHTIATLPGYVDSKITNSTITTTNISDFDSATETKIANYQVDSTDTLADLKARIEALENAPESISSSAELPIGFIYFQLPDQQDPTEMGLSGTWTNISTAFEGAFFRAEGGNSNLFESGLQLDEIKSHTHDILTYAGSISSAGSVLERGYGSGTAAKYLQNLGVTGGTETRPLNHTIRIWKKTGN